MCELDYKEGWVLKNWCFRTLVLEKTYESPLDSKEIKLVNPKGNQLWIFTGRTDAEAEAAILCLPDGKIWHIGKDPDVGKNWRQKEKWMTEDNIVGWHHQLNGHVAVVVQFLSHIQLFATLWTTTDTSLSKLWEMVKDSEAWGPAVHGVVKSQIWLRDWTKANIYILY